VSEYTLIYLMWGIIGGLLYGFLKAQKTIIRQREKVMRLEREIEQYKFWYGK
jgi:hypothetical protein